ncbi:hypothetical protein K438DRAFT_1872150 [Mycena galopus ATCC 62051]|nr:hypothetical protein K438DRAFT_1872150 [Mycena galopus ATCC 62051]
MPEREKGSPVPPVPSRTPPARRLAQAKYFAKYISSWKLGRYGASIKADPERVQEQKDRQKCADKAYKEKRKGRKQMLKRELSRVIRQKKKEIMLWNMHFGPTENRTSSRKRFLTLCGGTKTGM